MMDVVMTPGKKAGMDHWALRYPTNTEDVARVCYGGWFTFFSPSLSLLGGVSPSACPRGHGEGLNGRLTDCLCRRGGPVPGGARQGGAAEGAPVLERGQVHQVRDVRAVWRDHGRTNRPHPGQHRGQRPQRQRPAAVRLPPQHQGAEGARDRCVDAGLCRVVEARVQGVSPLRLPWANTRRSGGPFRPGW